MVMLLLKSVQDNADNVSKKELFMRLRANLPLLIINCRFGCK